MIKFTKEQKTIFHFVQHGSGHGIIDAVAGAGKTTTIMECAKYVVDKSTILFCAFNNSIAAEISRKFHQKELNQVTVKTIHALGRQILLDNNNSGHPIKLEENKYAEILKSEDIRSKISPHIERILTLNDFERDELDSRNTFAINNYIAKIHKRLLEINQKFRSTLTKDDVSELENLVIHFGIFNDTEIKQDTFREEIISYYKCHRILLDAGNELSERNMLIDFTDMLYLPYKWNQQPAKQYEFLFIDECQDLSKAQFATVAKYGKKNGRILAVGDPNQSIYGFTGADINSFNRVKEYTKAHELPLTTCFRCPQSIVELAGTIRSDIVGNKQEEGIIQTITFDDVAKLAIPGDLIISRFKAPIILLVFSFIDKEIKVHIHEDEVKEIINEIKNTFKQSELHLKIASLASGFEELKDVVIKRWDWIIQKNAEAITDSAERQMYIDNEKKYLKSKLEFLHKKYELWQDECKTITDLLKRVKNYISAKDNAIKLSTIHRAKGLENERVFVLNYDALPYFRQNQKEWEMTQEMNLKYVAITRASSELYLIENKKEKKIEQEESLFDNLPFD